VRRRWSWAAGLSLVPAIAVAAFVMYAAWQHNPQEVFHERGRVFWGPWLTIGASWFVAVFFPCLFLLRMALGLWPTGATPAVSLRKGR